MKSRNSNFIKTSRFGNNRIIPNQNLEVSSTVSFSALHVQTVNGVDITAEAQKQIDLTSKVDLLEARIFKLENIINVLLNV
jgi:hypothetical protein